MARLDRKVRKRVLLEFPSEHCNATAKRTGRRCERWRLVGSTICPVHGAMAKQVRAAAEKRIALAEARLDIRAVEPRLPGEVMTEAAHIADMAMRNALVTMPSPASEAQVASLMGHTSRAHHMSKVNHEAGLDEARYRLQAGQAAQISDLFTAILNDPELDLTHTQRARIPAVVARVVGAGVNGKSNNGRAQRKSLSMTAHISTA